VNDAIGWGDEGSRVTVVNVNGGLFETTSSGNQGSTQTWNLTGGTVRSNNGVAPGFPDFVAGRIVIGPGSVVETFASAASSVIEGQLFLRPGDGHTSQTFTVADGAAATDLLVSASIGAESGTMGLTKAGTGTMTVTGTNSYNGETLVAAGTFVANNAGDNFTSATGTGTVTVNSGATLAGTGRIAPADGNSVFINGILQIGDPTSGPPAAADLEIATSGSGSIVLGTTSELQFDLITGAGLGDNTGIDTAADRLIINGDFTITSGAKLIVANPLDMASWAEGDTWYLFDWSGLGTRTGFFETSDLLLPGLGSGLAWNTDDLYTGGTLSIVAAAVPEPGRAGLLLVACTIGVMRRRR
jgi:autotransporter-associated beta strand protein